MIRTVLIVCLLLALSRLSASASNNWRIDFWPNQSNSTRVTINGTDVDEFFWKGGYQLHHYPKFANSDSIRVYGLAVPWGTNSSLVVYCNDQVRQIMNFGHDEEHTVSCHNPPHEPCKVTAHKTGNIVALGCDRGGVVLKPHTFVSGIPAPRGPTPSQLDFVNQKERAYKKNYLTGRRSQS